MMSQFENEQEKMNYKLESETQIVVWDDLI